jgi:hypothetical protein
MRRAKRKGGGGGGIPRTHDGVDEVDEHDERPHVWQRSKRREKREQKRTHVLSLCNEFQHTRHTKKPQKPNVDGPAFRSKVHDTRQDDQEIQIVPTICEVDSRIVPGVVCVCKREDRCERCVRA